MRNREFWERLWRQGRAPRRKRRGFWVLGIVAVILVMVVFMVLMAADTVWAEVPAVQEICAVTCV